MSLDQLFTKLEESLAKSPFKLFEPLVEATHTFLLTPGKATRRGPHVRDNIDLKRYMFMVIVALLPVIIMGMYNIGRQAGIFDFWAALWRGALVMLPVVIVSYAVGAFWESIFAKIRGHVINEGLLVTGILFPLTLPPTIPLWQVAIGISFGIVIGKEVFGGTGMNLLNPALTARAFLFFTYPGNMSGDSVWAAVDGFSTATPLATAAAASGSAVDALHASPLHYTLNSMFTGFIPGSMGETSTLAILIGAAILILLGIGSWRIMLATALGGFGMASLVHWLAGSTATGMLSLPPVYQLVMGGFMFGTVFMTTDPVSAAGTNTGKWIYGILIGVMAILIRTFNPAYPEGMMLAILFGNVFSPLIDHFVVQANIKRRLRRV